MHTEVNPFDILSGKVVQNDRGTFYFKEPGNSNWSLTIWQGGYAPNRAIVNAKIQQELNCTLHRENGPAVIYKNGITEYWRNGLWYGTNKPFSTYND